MGLLLQNKAKDAVSSDFWRKEHRSRVGEDKMMEPEKQRYLVFYQDSLATCNRELNTLRRNSRRDGVVLAQKDIRTRKLQIEVVEKKLNERMQEWRTTVIRNLKTLFNDSKGPIPEELRKKIKNDNFAKRLEEKNKKPILAALKKNDTIWKTMQKQRQQQINTLITTYTSKETFVMLDFVDCQRVIQKLRECMNQEGIREERFPVHVAARMKHLGNTLSKNSENSGVVTRIKQYEDALIHKFYTINDNAPNKARARENAEKTVQQQYKTTEKFMTVVTESERNEELQKELKVQMDAIVQLGNEKDKLAASPQFLVQNLQVAQATKIEERGYRVWKRSAKKQIQERDAKCEKLEQDMKKQELELPQKMFAIDDKIREANENVRTINHLLGDTEYMKKGIPELEPELPRLIVNTVVN